MAEAINQTVIQREAPEIEAYKLGLMEKAKELTGTAPTAEELDALVATELGLSDLQQSGIDALKAQTESDAGIGGYKDFLTKAGTGLDTASNFYPSFRCLVCVSYFSNSSSTK